MDLHTDPPEEDEEYIRSAFREHYGMPLVTPSQSRAEARRQVEEFRQQQLPVS